MSKIEVAVYRSLKKLALSNGIIAIVGFGIGAVASFFFSSRGLTVEASLEREATLGLGSWPSIVVNDGVDNPPSRSDLSQLYLKIDRLLETNQQHKAVDLYSSYGSVWQSLVQNKMKIGQDVSDDLEKWEAFQLKIAGRFMTFGGFKTAEDILLDIAKRSPTNPSLTRMLDQLHKDRLKRGEG